MGKRDGDKHPREPHDFYPTEPKASSVLRSWIGGAWCYEPCAGDGALLDTLGQLGVVWVGASDIAPRRSDIASLDALELTKADVASVDLLVTNPPHNRELLHRLLEHFRELKPSYLLLPWDWFATQQARPYLAYCSWVMPIGRMRLIAGSPHQGFDNYAWARFEQWPTRTTLHTIPGDERE